jgi:flavin-dependent dehydrogenase
VKVLQGNGLAKRSITILGAGPAGLTAAINLAGAGFAVRVYERQQDVGRLSAGDLEGLENWSSPLDVMEQLAGMGVTDDFLCRPIRRLTVFNGSRQWHFADDRPLFYLVKRGSAPDSLDTGLKRQALKSGVEILFGQSFPEEKGDIVAIGAKARYRFAIDRGITFKTDLQDTAIGLVNDRAAFKGYAYLLSAGGNCCICTCIFDRFSRLNSCLETAIDMLAKFCSFAKHDEQRVGGVGAFRLHPRFADGKRLYVGEAAGVQDLLWGFGMRTAMRSGYLAARSIIEGTDYTEAARKNFGDYLKAGVVNRFLWETLRFDDYRLIMTGLASARNQLSFLGSFYNYGVLQRLLYPFAVLTLRRRYMLDSG